MKKNNSTWRALLLSLLSLILCTAMLAGSTHAWFTYKVSSPNNKIVSGNMALSLYQIEADAGGTLKETDITNASQPVFSGDQRWEPGDEVIFSFKLKNAGSLALKWQIHLVGYPTKALDKTTLLKKIDVYAFSHTEPIDPTKSSSFYAEKMGTKKGTLQDLFYGYEFFNGVLQNGGDEGYFAIVLKLQDNLDASYQGLNEGSFDIKIVTAQAAAENDNYDKPYDDHIYITSGKDFVDATYGGKLVMPSDLYYCDEIPGNKLFLFTTSAIDFDGKGNTLTLVEGVDPHSFNNNYVGFIPPAKTDITINNLKVTGTGFVAVGDHSVKPSGNYTVNNLIIENLLTTHVVTDGKKVAHAFGAYGTAVLNNCIMKGTTSADTAANVYDAGFPNNSNTTINGGEYGALYAWAASHVAIYGATVGSIDMRTLNGKGSMVIGAGTTVDTITIIKVGSYKPSLVIMPGANVGTIHYNSRAYTMEEWVTENPLGLQP